ncbi:MAG TPA: mucoidy inhibitor MuiA family protein [Polyangiaceae bacterium]|nr:mucoidy inhibitor MuiA family protein [Polyangiaceae bacterium]
MLKVPGLLQLGRVALGAWLTLALGCGQAATTAKPVASVVGRDAAGGGADAPIPQASQVFIEDDPNAVAISSSIRKVTVYSDRALVTREATIKLATAPTVYAFRQLPGWVDDGSVRVATTAGRIADVRVARSYLARANEQSYLKAESANRDLNGRLLALDDELKVLDAQAKQIDDIKAFSLDKLNKDVVAGNPGGAGNSGSATPPGNVGVNTYAAVVEFIATKLRDIAKGRRGVAAEREKLAPAALASKKQLEELRALTQLEETKVFVTVQGPSAGEAQLQLTYLLPGATWESAHELRTEGGEATAVELTSYAVVTQASGEDWDRAELTFSTQSSTAAVRIPELAALTLGDTRAQTQSIETRSASFKRAEAAFKGQNRLWNKRVQSDSSENFEESYQTNFESLQVTQSKTVQIFQSLQQRGTTAQFKALSTTNVRADGRSVRVPIGHAELKAKKSLVAAPEQSLNAAQTLEMLNDSGHSLLPGNVALYQTGAFLGMTNLDFVADGEDFSLFLSVADQLKLSRALDKKHSALVRKQRTQMQLAFIVTVENLSGKVMSLNLADRVPVSEDRDVVISGVKISPDVKPDSKGILRFALTLQPKEKRQLEIQYQIEYPPTLVVEMKRNQAGQPAPMAAEMASPAPLLPRRAYDIKQDIEQLESAF